MRNNIDKNFRIKKLFKFGLLSILVFPISLEIFAKYIIGLGNPPLLIEHKSIEYEYIPNQDIKRFHKQIKINSLGMRSDELLEDSNNSL